MSYYIYGHYKPNEDRPFYVGKGSKKRAWNRNKRSEYWHRVVNKYFSETKFPVVKLLSNNIDSEKTAFELEKFWIALFGRQSLNEGCLINFTDGGEGSSGFKHSEKTKRLAAARVTGDKNPYQNPETIRKASRSHGFSGCWMIHKDHGKHWCDVMSTFAKKWNLSKSQLGQVINNFKGNVSVQGWQVFDEHVPVKSEKDFQIERAKKISKAKGFTGCFLVHPIHGTLWCENQTTFAKKWNLSNKGLSNIIRKTKRTHKGWVVK